MANKQTAEYKNNFAREKYDRLEIRIDKGKKAVITAHAKTYGKSLNGFVKEAIDEKIERDRRDRENGAT